MIRLGEINISPYLPLLEGLDWKPSRRGYAMRDVPGGFQPIFRAVGEMTEGYVGMACLSRLIPGQFIPPHVDRHDNGCRARVHVPLTTNPACVFVEDEQAFHMSVGEVYVIDPSLPHCVANAGDTDRIHLFFNMVSDA